jgi:hypothetical protein
MPKERERSAQVWTVRLFLASSFRPALTCGLRRARATCPLFSSHLSISASQHLSISASQHLSISASQHFSISAFTSRLPLSFQNDSREGNHSALGKFSIFIEGSSPRFPASGRSICSREIGSLHSVKICTITLFPNHNILMRAMTPSTDLVH